MSLMYRWVRGLVNVWSTQTHSIINRLKSRCLLFFSMHSACINEHGRWLLIWNATRGQNFASKHLKSILYSPYQQCSQILYYIQIILTHPSIEWHHTVSPTQKQFQTCIHSAPITCKIGLNFICGSCQKWYAFAPRGHTRLSLQLLPHFSMTSLLRWLYSFPYSSRFSCENYSFVQQLVLHHIDWKPNFWIFGRLHTIEQTNHPQFATDRFLSIGEKRESLVQAW